jgi:hypothetical protein
LGAGFFLALWGTVASLFVKNQTNKQTNDPKPTKRKQKKKKKKKKRGKEKKKKKKKKKKEKKKRGKEGLVVDQPKEVFFI